MNFFVLIPRPNNVQSKAETEYEKIEPINRGDAPKCEKCGNYIGLLTWLPPYRVNIELWGNDFGDIVWGIGLNLLVSERFVSMYRQYRFTGLSGFDPVEIVKVKRKRKRKKISIPNYFRVKVDVGRAAIDHKLSGLDTGRDNICNVCRGSGSLRKIDRFILEENTWDGRDIFVAIGVTGTILVTQCFKEACEESDILNAVFVEAEKHRIDHTFGKDN